MTDVTETKTCPRCAEDVRAAAQVCRYCGHEFGDGTDAGSPRGAGPESTGALARFALPVSIAAWCLSLVPLTASLVESGSTEDIILSAVGAVGYSIGLATVLRGPYAFLRKRPFASPWLFVIALALSLLAIAGWFVEE